MLPHRAFALYWAFVGGEVYQSRRFGEGVERREGEARTGAVRRGGTRRARRRIRSIPTTERRHRESLFRNGAKHHSLVIPRLSRDSCVQEHAGRLVAGA